ncbi:MAG: NAD(P)/FAD-dependent oxidoreductase [Acidimicrobiales bacterium]|nr:NAD(P)/FAD-dependent oxidoreductase [Acidimicrobiales bacterium]
MAEENYFDVIVVGAGISGIGSAYRLQKECPDRSFVILEGRPNLGGTWDLFRYPGIRSDSDMHTLGFSFKPWKAAKSIADGPAILEYLEETVDEFNIKEKIKFNHLVSTAEWSNQKDRWTLKVSNNTTGEIIEYACNFLLMCSGYYSYKSGYTPSFEGVESYSGQIVHPQEWPEDIDYADKKVVVIGSGATAVTLVPAMADTAEHVVMLQRSPTYVVARPDHDAFAGLLRKILPERVAYYLTRKKNIFGQNYIYKLTRKDPEKVKEKLLSGVRMALGPDYDVERHFTPSYNPWDERLCLIPNGDLFKSIRKKKVSVVTETIDRFTPEGLLLKNGDELKADIIVTATGLNLVTLGEVNFRIDGDPVDFSETWIYKGLAYSDVPNLISTFGYINASWTLRADINSSYACRILNHMKKTGTKRATPRLRESDMDMPQRDWIEGFSSGYMKRSMSEMPKQGDREPWLNTQDFYRDKKMLSRNTSLEDGVMEFV